MNKTLEQIFARGIVVDEYGSQHKLHSHTREEQGIFIQEILRDLKPEKSLEVGLAFGISTLFICETLAELKKGKHIVMDPYQKDWKNIGLRNIDKAGYSDIVEFFNEFSDVVLPQEYFKGTRIQFAYIDSTKVFDVLMVDLYFINKMLDVGGIVVFDDCQFPGIKKLCRFLLVHPSFQKYKTFKKINENANKQRLSLLARAVPHKEKIFSQDLLSTDTSLGINYHCIAFKKVQEDKRDWKWNELF